MKSILEFLQTKHTSNIAPCKYPNEYKKILSGKYIWNPAGTSNYTVDLIEYVEEIYGECSYDTICKLVNDYLPLYIKLLSLNNNTLVEVFDSLSKCKDEPVNKILRHTIPAKFIWFISEVKKIDESHK